MIPIVDDSGRSLAAPASTDAAQILAWWSHHPSAAVGVVVGSDEIVIEVIGRRGARTLRKLEATFGALPKTREMVSRCARLLFFRGGGGGGGGGRDLGPGLRAYGRDTCIMVHPGGAT